MQNTGPRFQSSLGRKLKRRYKDSQNIDRISFGRVIKVNYKYNTVDVVTDKGGFSSAEEGRYAAKLPVLFGGRNLSGYEYGQVNPIAIGSLVLIGFVEGDKVSPVVLGVYNDIDEASEITRTSLLSSGPLDKELSRETLQQFTLHPSLTYENIDGKGNIFRTLPGMAFLTVESGASASIGGPSDDGDGTEYGELPASYYSSGELIVPEELRSPNILFRHEGSRVDNGDLDFKVDDHVFMWFLDEEGNHRKTILSDKQDWKTFTEMDAQGWIKLKHQKDTKRTNNSEEYNEILVGPEGSEISSKSKSLDTLNSIKLTEEGLLVVVDAEGERQEIQMSPSGLEIQIKDTQIEVTTEGLSIEDAKGSKVLVGKAGIDLSSGETSLQVTSEELNVNQGEQSLRIRKDGTEGDMMIPENRRTQMDNNTEEIVKIWEILNTPEEPPVEPEPPVDPEEPEPPVDPVEPDPPVEPEPPTDTETGQ